MKRWFWLLPLLAALALAAFACDNDDDDDDDAAADDDDDDDDDDNDDDATPPPTLVGKYTMNLDFEVEFKGRLNFKLFSDDTIEAAFIPETSFDVIAAGTVLNGTGRIVSFPEARGRMINAKLQGPVVPGGACGQQAVSYSVALTAREGNTYYVGGLTAYCGAEAYTGRGARLMRLSGELVEVE